MSRMIVVNLPVQYAAALAVVMLAALCGTAAGQGSRRPAIRRQKSEIGRGWNNHGSDMIAGSHECIQGRVNLRSIKAD